MNDLARRFAAEVVGTFVLVFVGTGSAMVGTTTRAFGHVEVSLTFGVVVAMVVAALGNASGAHINPAVTVAFWAERRFPGRDVLPYVAAQCAGAVAASLSLRWLLGPAAQMGATVPSIGIGRSFVVEVVYSAILALVIFGVAIDERVPRSVPPFAIGATVFAGALVMGPLTGASFNPARSLGPAVAGGGWAGHWLYWVAPVAGMLAGARLHALLRDTASPDVVPKGVPVGREGPIP